MSKAERYNKGKPELSYILDFPKAVEALCRVKEYGAKKYAKDNWKAGGKPDEEYYNSLLRHLFSGATDVFDPESGCLHAAHAIWNLMAWIELNYDGPLYDPELDTSLQSTTSEMDPKEVEAQLYREAISGFNRMVNAEAARSHETQTT